jgi:hypothetical protein
MKVDHYAAARLDVPVGSAAQGLSMRCSTDC